MFITKRMIQTMSLVGLVTSLGLSSTTATAGLQTVTASEKVIMLKLNIHCYLPMACLGSAEWALPNLD